MSQRAVAGVSGVRVRRRLPMEVYEDRPGTRRRRQGVRPSPFTSDLVRVCGLRIKPKSLCQREIELLLEKEDVSDDSDYDLVEGPLSGFVEDDDDAVQGPRVSDDGDDEGDELPRVGDDGGDGRHSVGDSDNGGDGGLSCLLLEMMGEMVGIVLVILIMVVMGD